MDRLELDDRDRKIIALFEQNPEISQTEIAEHVGLSQPTVGARIIKLKNSGALATSVGVDLKRAGMNVAKVDITTRDSNKVIDLFKQCPYFLNGLIVSGKENLSIFFAAEDIATIEALVGRHLRSNPSVTSVDFGIVISSVQSLTMPVKIGFEKTDISPCGYNCPECQYYVHNQCLGCPMTTHYKGTFW
ncbi:Lrp/AsnC family transcriptional regulator [Methanocella sp. MCL-LM]|uniref:Lrp/AsnC family transcriptional regulator n=1 Tax=Methanocella sp. MCL-LM TaxID=3412035 RepID=UPI003C7636FF